MNDQERFWGGAAGSEYTKRNRVDWSTRLPFWTKVLGIAQPRSVLEVGCNAGWNLIAARVVDHTMKLRGVDLNEDALAEARTQVLDVRCYGASEVGSLWPREFDMVFTAGVLIHVSPRALPGVMASIARASKEWVLAIEYESDHEEEIPYRGQADKLWKRPFGKLYQEMGLRVEERIENAEGFDRCTAWLLRK